LKTPTNAPPRQTPSADKEKNVTNTQTLMEKEILESPMALRRFLSKQWNALVKTAEAISERKPRFATLVARGTSDNACTYARYLIEKEWGIPVSLAAPSVKTLYGAKIDYSGGLVVGVSQSGQGPDVCDMIQTARSQGALTVGVTNNSKSRLAKEAEYTLDLMSGPEKSVAATKTYTSELLALYALVQCVVKGRKIRSELTQLPRLVEEGCKLSKAVWDSSYRFLQLNTCVVVGRGFHYGLAQEASLKLKECAQVMAHAYSTADFHHGPKTLAGKDFPVILLAPPGPTLKGTLELLDELFERHAFIVAFSPVKQVLDKASLPFPTPGGPEEVNLMGMAPMIQTLALAVAMAKGLNPDKPPFIKKVTQTK
jgi:glutamine---fructose-6-phosphate transaminase (isomerizing)